MGAVARGALEAGGEVIGVIPEALANSEVANHDCSELYTVSGMHERKQRMFETSDAFVALPGGIGTLEELVEQLTWSQLGQHEKPVVLANIAGFWDPFLNLIDHMREQAFIRDGLEVRCTVVASADQILPIILDAWKLKAPETHERDVLEKF